MGNIVIASPNEAKVISGCGGTKVVVGACECALWCCQSVETLSLEIMTLTLKSIAAETAHGVPVTITAIAQIKVMANKFRDEKGNDIQGEKMKRQLQTGGLGGGGAGAGSDESKEQEDGFGIHETEEVDIGKIRIAAQHFLGRSRDAIKESLRQTMEGHQRQILGTLTVEELYKDRAAFSSRVRGGTTTDLYRMGFVLVSYTVTQIDDEMGYMAALGAKQTAKVKGDAQKGQAEHESDARKRVAEYTAAADIAEASAQKDSHVQVNVQEKAKAESDRDLNMKRAEYAKQINEADAVAAAATGIARAQQQQSIMRETTQQQVEEATVLVEVTKREVEKQKAELEGNSQAELMAQRNQAEGIKVLAQAEADRIKAMGDAEAGATQAKGEAEAEVLRKKAEAFKQYGEAAIVQSIVERMPEIAGAISAPLAQTEKMIFISQDGSSASRLTNDVVGMVGSIPAAVEGLTGINLREAIGTFAKKPAAAAGGQ
jgi:flotillin